LRRGCWD